MNSYDDNVPSGAIDDMLDDLEVGPADEAALRDALRGIGALANETPEPSSWVSQLISGELLHGTLPDETTVDGVVQFSPNRRRLAIAAAAGALVFGGASAAAATNNLPAPIQEAVANATRGLPVKAPHPHPTKPTHAPSDAPGQLKDTSKHDHSDHSDTSKHDNSKAPGQIQKATKPEPGAPGPAKPANPGSFGRDRAAAVQADHTKGDNKKDGDKKYWGPVNQGKGHVKPLKVKNPKSQHSSDGNGKNHGKNHGHGH